MTSSSSDRPGEFELIAEFFAPLSKSAPGAFGLTDDAAVISPKPDEELVVTTDALVEGVHFLSDDPPDTIAKKALRVNLSDLAAKGAEARAYLLALALPDRWTPQWLEAFARGFAEDQKKFGIALIGGDTTRTPGPLTIAITALGVVPRGSMIRRAGANAGDLVFVSGTVGDAGAGLGILKDAARENASTRELVMRFRVPSPRLGLGVALRGLAHAALDVSDGLLADLGHIAKTSKVRIEIDAERIPLSKAFRALAGETIEARRAAATSGDDYEIAFAAAPRSRQRVLAAAKRSRVPVTEVGRVVAGEGVAVLNAAGRELEVPVRGYTHF